MSNGELVIASCKCGRPFAEKVIGVLNQKGHETELLDTSEITFANSEMKTMINRSIRGADFFLIQDCETREFGYSTADAVAAMKSALDAAFRAGASRKTLIILSFPYARQDKAKAREGITASRLAQELEDVYCVDNVFYMDIHNTTIAGFFRRALADNLSAIRILSRQITEQAPDCTRIVYADAGGCERATDFALLLDKDLAGFQKRRDNTTGRITSKLVGDASGEVCVGIEDMIGTGGTICETTEILSRAGAKKVYWAATHGLLNGEAARKISALFREGKLSGIICTDSVYHSQEFRQKNPWYTEVSVASYVAKAINHLHTGKSISGLLND